MLRVIKYLKCMLNHVVLFKTSLYGPSDDVVLESFADADWGSDVSDRRSVYGHYLLLN